MKWRQYLRLSGWGLALFFLACSAVTAAQPQIKPVTDENSVEAIPSRSQDLKPFVVGTFKFTSKTIKRTPKANYSAYLIERALLEYGYRMELKTYPGRRLMAQLNTGAIDGDMARTFDMSVGFANVIRVEEPIVRPCVLLLRTAANHSIDINNPDKPVKIGLFAGAPGGAAIVLSRWPSAELVNFENLKQGAQLLMSDRIDLFAIGEVQLPMVSQFIDRPIERQDAFYLPPLYMHVHKRHDELAVRLAASLKLLKRRFPAPTCDLESLQNGLAQ